MRFFLLLLALTVPLHAVVYVPPDETKSLFKRDLLPLDTDTMRDLSGYLTDLARRDIGEDPIHWRATAQLLAIATRLDPANRPARDLGLRLAKGNAQPPPPNMDFVPAISGAWRIVEWLLQPEAGKEGLLLGYQLIDALHVVDPRHPLAKRYHRDGELARWDGIVAELARFEALDPPAPPSGPTSLPEPDPLPPPPPVKRSPVKLRQASLITPLYLYDDQLTLQLRVAPLTMTVVERQEANLFSFALSPSLTLPLLDTARERVRRSLERTWPHLPLQESALLDTSGERYAARNSTAISGPASLLMHAALEGRELRPDLVFLSDLKEDGSLTRPMWSWEYLRALRVARGGRLIVPTDLQPELRAMLALESPEFFQKWEVLVVSSLNAALSLATTEGSPEGLSEASRLFAGFQELAAGKPVGPFCVNDRIRARFGEILAEAPFHYSASMLLLQGSIERPTRLEREVAARILRSGIEPLLSLGRAPLTSLNSNRLEAAFEASRAGLEPLSKYLRRDDQDLEKEAMDLTDLARSLARALRVGDRDPKGNIISKTGVPVTTLHQELHDGLTAYLRILAPFTGEELAPPAALPAIPAPKTP